MIITILGSGTSGGVPMIGCHCEVCSSGDSRDKRLRTSILLQINNKNFVFDAGPDFRQQMLREKVDTLEAIIFTHPHRDHTAGLDDVRAYNHFQQKAMDIYVTAETENSLRKEYHYVFNDVWYPGLPKINFCPITNTPFNISEITFIPIEVMHYKMKVFGYRIEDFTYITDANFISNEEKSKIFGCKVLILNALRKEKHISHFNLEEALQLIEELKPEKAYLTHLSHQMGKHAEVTKELPENVFIAYDGLQIEL
ncbi:MAG: MBL fold metallo-hydrolase [Bacteroidetes bacterium]|nr:MBL fold metallo-hydrolase [Bacteroidota bacterium]MBK7569825.1 MBL fold metallo-hydrolase [Bacteroidota bacterium]MBP7541720.1 MBL fold metallo-hydrolase [Saprospiraceae bacterium]